MNKSKINDYINLYLKDQGLIRSIYNNFHAITGDVYRSSQPSPSMISRYKKKYNIKTIINLRGETPYGFFKLEKERCKDLGIKLINIKMNSKKLMSKTEIYQLLNIFDTLEYPVLFHCKSGADRTSFLAALYILHNSKDINLATKQLSLKYLHLKNSSAGILDLFFTIYKTHSNNSKDFYDWLENHYDMDEITTLFKKNKRKKNLFNILNRE